MEEGSKILTYGNIGQAVSGIRFDATKSGICRHVTTIDTGSFAEICGNQLITMVPGRIAGIDVWVVCNDWETMKKLSQTPNGSRRVLLAATQIEDSIAGSGIVLGSEDIGNGRYRLRSLTAEEEDAVLDTVRLFQFTQNAAPMSAFVMTGFEAD